MVENILASGPQDSELEYHHAVLNALRARLAVCLSLYLPRYLLAKISSQLKLMELSTVLCMTGVLV